MFLNEFLIFGFFLIFGAIFAIFFSFGIIFLKKIKSVRLKTAIEIVSFSMFLCFFGLFFFILMLKFNFGVFRAYMLVATLLGFLVCYKTFGKLFAFIFEKFYTYIERKFKNRNERKVKKKPNFK